MTCSPQTTLAKPNRTFKGALVVVLMGAACSAPSVRARALVNYLELDGDIGTSVGPLSNENSLDALGLDNPETIIVPRVGLNWSTIHVSFEGFQTEFSGSGVAEATLDLGGTPITAGEPVDSEFDLGLYQSRFVWDFLPDPLQDLGLGIGVGYLDYEVKVASKTGPGIISGGDGLPFAFLTGRAAKAIGDFEVLVLAGGGAIKIDDESYNYIDLEAILTWAFWDEGQATAELVIGYRYLRYEYEFDAGTGGEFDIDATLDGPVVGVSVKI
jgi:hypothetical protein